MILDTLDRWREYGWLNERIMQGFQYLETLDPNIENGTHKIDGDNLYCMIQPYETTPLTGHEFEAHRLYADIQYMMSGEESILWAPVRELAVTKPYVADIEFYGIAGSPTELVLTPGRFAVFFPHDAHAPCIAHGTACSVRKAVIKVRLT